MRQGKTRTTNKPPAPGTGETPHAALVAAAREVRGNAHAPYSKYKVGAALVTKSGAVFTGCNVENASYGGTICAERSAICAMVAAGESDPVAIAVATGGRTPGSPCGICRQVLREFARDMPVALVAVEGKRVARRDTTLAVLLPDAFDGSVLLEPEAATSTKSTSKRRRT